MSFATFPLETLSLPAPLLQACTRAGLATASDVLLAAPGELSKKLKGSVHVSDVVGAVSRAIAPASHTAAETLSAAPDEVRAYVSTGDAALDGMLGGGARIGAITEVTGESAAGKSHLTLALAVAAQLGPTPGGAVVLTSERVLAASRLVEIARALRDAVPDPPPLTDILDNVHTSRVADIDALEHALAFVVPPMLAARASGTHSALRGELADPAAENTHRRGKGTKPIRVLVLDSVTALLRGETERSSMGLAQRSRYLCALADRLKALAVEYALAVVVVNQVKDVFAPGFGVGVPIPSLLPGVPTPNAPHPASEEALATQVSLSQASSDAADTPPMLYATQARHFSGQSPGFAKEAALGIVWANAVNARLMLARTGRRRVVTDDDLRGKRPRPAESREEGGALTPAGAGVLGLGDDKILVRRFHLVFSPFAPPATLDYVITEGGIATLPGTLRYVDLGPAIRRRDLRLRAALPANDAANSTPPQPSRLVDLEGAVHLGSDAYDDMDIPPEMWEGLDAEVQEPGSPVAVGVVD